MVKRIKWIYIASFGLLAAGILVLIVMPWRAMCQINRRQQWQICHWSHSISINRIIFSPISFGKFYCTIEYGKVKSQCPCRNIGFVSALGGTSGSVIIGNLFDLLGGTTFLPFAHPLTILLITCFLNERKTTT